MLADVKLEAGGLCECASLCDYVGHTPMKSALPGWFYCFSTGSCSSELVTPFSAISTAHTGYLLVAIQHYSASTLLRFHSVSELYSFMGSFSLMS